MSRFRSLLDKLEDNDYLESLSIRRKGELQICKEFMTEEELDSYSSIAVAYNRIARRRFIRERYGEDYLDKVDSGAIHVFVRYNDEELIAPT